LRGSAHHHLSTDDACQLLVDELRAPDWVDDTAILLLRRRVFVQHGIS
jgi:hypothetical protein